MRGAQRLWAVVYYVATGGQMQFHDSEFEGARLFPAETRKLGVLRPGRSGLSGFRLGWNELGGPWLGRPWELDDSRVR